MIPAGPDYSVPLKWNAVFTADEIRDYYRVNLIFCKFVTHSHMNFKTIFARGIAFLQGVCSILLFTQPAKAQEAGPCY